MLPEDHRDSAGIRAKAGYLAAALGQLALAVAVLMAYRMGRHWVDGDPADAMANARSLWDAQRALGLPDEAALQSWALGWDGWVTSANRYYVLVHFPLTGLFLAWVWVRHRPAWSRVRAAIVLSMVLALILHAAYPLAPPRLLPELGMIDLMNVYGPSAYADQPGEGVSNQFAAMPSLHVGWAVLVAWGVLRYGRGPVRWLAVAHPVITTLVVVLTANHYWLDGIAGTAVVAVSLAVTVRLERRAGEIASPYGQRGIRAGGQPLRRPAG
jgi:PAP2 superfamily protein